jgi:hypothetical protein
MMQGMALALQLATIEYNQVHAAENVLAASEG